MSQFNDTVRRINLFDNVLGSAGRSLDMSISAALSSRLLNGIIVGVGDKNCTIDPSTTLVYINAAFTAPRTWTLPAANSLVPGQSITVIDLQGTITGSNTLLLTALGSDKFQPANTNQISLTANGAGITVISDGISKWMIWNELPGQGVAAGSFAQYSSGAWAASGYTIPIVVGNAGTLYRSNGTNVLSSTATFPDTAAAQNVLVTSAANTWAAVDIGAWDAILKVSGSDATTTGQTLVDITGLVTGTLVVSTLYEIEAVLYVATSAVVTGTQYGINVAGTGSPVVVANIEGSVTSTTGGITSVTANNTAGATAFLTTSAEIGIIVIKGMITTGTGTPTIAIRHLKVTSGTSTVKIGSVFKYRKA